MHQIAFLGCGGIATSHAFALSSLVYYYGDNYPYFNKKYIAARNNDKANKFKEKFGFQEAISIDSLFAKNDFDTIFILTSNSSHFEYLMKSIEHKTIKNIYIEKPVCCSKQELDALNKTIGSTNKNIQVGFQFLQMAAIRKALQIWSSLDFGKLIHFNARYLHSDYLDKSYRDKRANRLIEAPTGGALADLGSHGLSILVKFIGSQLQVKNVLVSGSFEDVPKQSDLCTLISLQDKKSGAIGTLTASRISYGTGDQLEFELFATNGSIKFSSLNPDYLSYAHNHLGDDWIKSECANDFTPHSTFPNTHVPAGWLRSLIHAHYIFLTGNDKESAADFSHGLEVQRLILDCVNNFRV